MKEETLKPSTEALVHARERSGFTQDEVATLVSQPRPIISNWESGVRTPNAQQLVKLSAIYRVPLEELLGDVEVARPDFERLMFREAGTRLDAQGKFEIQRFLAFLDSFADFLRVLDEGPGLTRSPLSLRDGFVSKEDVRRKAEEARGLFRLGMGPVPNLLELADLAGIAVYQAPLGKDLRSTVSGAFLPHDRVGFSVMVNIETTPGHRQFTLAHELAHALFHGDKLYVDFFGHREAAERFANAFAAEFLVPVQSLRAAAEALGESKVTNPEDVIHLQRLFGVSFSMMLVRLQAAGLVNESTLERFRSVRPVRLAKTLGYATENEEWEQTADSVGLEKFPPRFLRLLRHAVSSQLVTLGGAAAMVGLSQEDIAQFVRDQPSSPSEEEEFDYYMASA